MKSKKAEQFTLSEFMKIVLGVLSIGLLLFLAAAIYGMFSKESEIKQATATLGEIKDIINKAEEGKSYTFMLESPANWVLVFYGKDTDGKLDVGMPKLCNGKDCLCICIYKGQNPDCDSNGICENIENIQKTGEVSLGIMIDVNNIYLSKLNGKILIERNAGAYKKSEDIFENLLKYKINENSKSVEELSMEYITDLTPEKINNGMSYYSQEDDLTKAIKAYFGEGGAFNFKIYSPKGEEVFSKSGVNPGNAEFNYRKHEKEIVNAKGEKYKIYLKTYGVN